MSDLEKATKHEEEHKPTYDWIVSEFEKGNIPSAKEVYKRIAQDHIKDYPKYYTFLYAMEELLDET